MASRNIDALIDACTHAKVPCPTLDALRAALVKAGVGSFSQETPRRRRGLDSSTSKTQRETFGRPTCGRRDLELWRGRDFKGMRASPNDLAPQADTRVRGERTQSATTIYGNAGRPKGAAELATVLLRCILFAALITPAMVLAVELLAPTRGTQTRTLYAGATDL